MRKEECLCDDGLDDEKGRKEGFERNEAEEVEEEEEVLSDVRRGY